MTRIYIYALAIFFMFSCSNSENEFSEEIQLVDRTFKSLSATFYEDEVIVEQVEVNLDTSNNHKDLNIHWKPISLNNPVFITEYSKRLVRNISDSDLVELDTLRISFENQQRQLNYELIEYSHTEIVKLKKDYDLINPIFDDLLGYIAKNRLDHIVEFFDSYMLMYNSNLDTNNRINWLDDGFLPFCKMAIFNSKDPKQKQYTQEFIEEFFGSAVLWCTERSALELINFLRSKLEMPILTIHQKDTIKTGFCPIWLRDT